MERSYQAVDVVCPFFRDLDARGHKIRCEGLIDSESAVHFFRYRSEFETQVKVFCQNHYDKCEYAAALLLRQEEEVNQREAIKKGMELKAREAGNVDAVYRNYGGRNRYSVWNPKWGILRVAAPEYTSAIVAAAEVWGVRWQDAGFYSSCEVKKI